MKEIASDRSGKKLRIGLVVSRFNAPVTEGLLQGAFRGLKSAGVSKRAVTLLRVPGAFELPGASQRLALTGDVDAIVCLGAVIRGETEHFTFISSAAQQGIMEVMLSTGVPIIFGVLTTETGEQALARSGEDDSNKGYEAALDAVEMANLYRNLR
jgi:6,7-dimethyl-8-ribityllumazine synthase